MIQKNTENKRRKVDLIMKRGTIKNWMAALLCVFLITGILSGCRNSAEKPSNDDSTALLTTEETDQNKFDFGNIFRRTISNQPQS